jgi:hypothetical protein
MRITTLVCAFALALAGAKAVSPSGAVAQNSAVGMDGGSGVQMNPVPVPAAEQDPAERSARSIECAQKADARALQGKTRKRFLHECRSGI